MGTRPNTEIAAFPNLFIASLFFVISLLQTSFLRFIFLLSKKSKSKWKMEREQNIDAVATRFLSNVVQFVVVSDYRMKKERNWTNNGL